LRRGRFYALISAAAVATPLLLWKAPTDFLPILLGDYLATHFVVWGALLWVGALWLGGTSPSPLPLRERVGVRGWRRDSRPVGASPRATPLPAFGHLPPQGEKEIVTARTVWRTAT
jgi:hypothetical protein